MLIQHLISNQTLMRKYLTSQQENSTMHCLDSLVVNKIIVANMINTRCVEASYCQEWLVSDLQTPVVCSCKSACSAVSQVLCSTETSQLS